MRSVCVSFCIYRALIIMKPIHVVHIIPKLGFGGAERFVVELTRHVSNKTVRQSVITLWDDRPLMSELPSGVSCTVFPFDTIGYFNRISKLKKLLREMGADVVHTHLFSADLWGRLAARSLGLPIVTTEHNINKGESWLWGKIKYCMRNFSTIYTAPSRAVQEFMRTAYGIRKENVQVIMHGIELSNFSAIKKAKFISPYRLGIIGRLVRQKGHSVALEALSNLKDISCELVIVGDGEEKENLIRYASELGVSDRVVWKKFTTNVSELYGDCDVVLVPSRWEGLGIVVLEALASERVVIASAVGGIPEIITSGENGILVPEEDAHALSSTIRECVENKEASRAIAKRGRAWAEAHADVHEMARTYEEVYLKLLA